MNICRTCTRQDVCDLSQYDDFCLNYDEKPQTNADKIRAMTDEELADWIISITEDDTEGWLDWLKQEVSE